MSLPKNMSAFVLRLPTPLKREVQRVARVNKRSMTKEIESVLERHVAVPDVEHAVAVAQR